MKTMTQQQSAPHHPQPTSQVTPLPPLQPLNGLPPLRVLRLKGVMAKIGIARSTLYDWMNPDSPRYDEHFPKSFKIGRHSVGWFEHQLDEWLTLRAATQLTA